LLGRMNDSAARALSGAVALALAALLVLGVMPQSAFAYFNRGAVSVELGSQAVEVAAGQTTSVSVAITPSSDNQTEGCGMPKCPQGCSASCTDENGQCTCAGKDYKTYYPTAQAVSSNSSVAVATYSSGTLTVYAKQAGEATITLRASLRQYTDAETTLSVKVTGSADGATLGSNAYVEIPEQAATSQEDKVDVVEKTVMNRAIRMVRITDGLVPQAHLSDFVGVDGDVTFWSGDTYYHPDYSMTFKGTELSSGSAALTSAALSVSTKAEGTLYQALSGKDCFVAVDFAQKGALPGQATVYAWANGAIADDKEVALYSYDEASKSFVAEQASATMVGGYASFTVSEGKTYVVSCKDISGSSNAVVTGGATQTNASGSCCDPSGSSASSSGSTVGQQVLSPFLAVVIAAVIAAAVGAAVAVFVMKRKGVAAGGSAGAVDSSSNGSEPRQAADSSEREGSSNEESR
jgi:hypothetical protein